MTKRKVAVAVGLVLAFTVLLAAPAMAADAAETAEPAPEVYNKWILDNLWVFIAGVLVFFMQAGFALVEAGLTRAKNAANIMAKNLSDAIIGLLAFFAVGYGIAYGADSSSLFGSDGWFLLGDSIGGNSFAASEGGLQLSTNFFFQSAFAATAVTIASGAMAERTKFVSYLVFSAVMTALIYPVVVHWFWSGEGILADLDINGAKFGDFAGSTIVHSVGGWAALMGAVFLGPRIGRFGPDGKPRALPGHSVPLVILGVLILWIGWFGFNPGSELAADELVVGIAVNTTLAAAAGGLIATIVVWLKSGKPDPTMVGNGVLAGLVSITAGCGTMNSLGALVSGAVGGLIVVLSVAMFDRLRIDDPVGAISVHGVCGVWGTLAVGLFALNGDVFVDANVDYDAGETFEASGLFYGGGFDQLIVQAIGVVIVAAFVLAASAIVFALLKATIGLRVSEEEEVEGLDVLEHGVPGYHFDQSVMSAG